MNRAFLPLLCLATNASLALAANMPPVIKTQIADRTIYAGVTARLDLTNSFDDPDTNAVRFSTVLGTFDVQLFTGQKPITVANFLNYLDQGRYFKVDPTTHHRASSFVHRSIANFVIQGGGYIGTVNPSDPNTVQPTQVVHFGQIANEPGISNTRGTIAMAKLGTGPNTATSEWFINLRDNGGPPNNLDTTNGGFTVFGKVLGNGMTIVDKIAMLPRFNAGGAFTSLPVRNYVNPNPVRIENFVSIPDLIRIPPFTFIVSSSNSMIATASVSGGRVLLINAKQVGSATINIRATDYDGAFVTQHFNVTVVASPGRLVNIATRANVLNDPNQLIAGFVIGGTSSKRVLIRGIGPSLAQFHVANPLADPTLELRDPIHNTLLATSNDWHDGAARQAIIDSGLAPKSTSESAILMTLPANNSSYTAIMRGVNGTGVGLVEVYDLDTAPGSNLLNLSSRGLVQTGDNVIIGGIIIGGTSSTRVLLRGIGPSLAAAMVPNPLADPKLELHNAQGAKIIENNNWQAAPNAPAIAGTGFAPTDAHESAIFMNQAPGNYTAILSGVGAAPTGVGVVEAYNLP